MTQPPEQGYPGEPGLETTPVPPETNSDYGSAYQATPTYEAMTHEATVGSTSDASTKDVAKDQASGVKDSAKESAQHVTGVAKEQASQVTSEAGRQAKDLLAQGRDELQQQASTQHQRAASGLHALGDELHSMAHGSQDQGVATDLARQAGDRAKSAAQWLESREPGDVLQEVKSFARQRPATFLGVAALAGIVVGRLGRGLKEGPTSQSSGAAQSSPTAPTATTSATPATRMSETYATGEAAAPYEPPTSYGTSTSYGDGLGS